MRVRLLSKQKRRSAIKRGTAKKERWSQWSHSWITFKVNKKETKNVNNEVCTRFVDTSGLSENEEKNDWWRGKIFNLNFESATTTLQDEIEMRGKVLIVWNLKANKKLETIFLGKHVQQSESNVPYFLDYSYLHWILMGRDVSELKMRNYRKSSHNNWLERRADTQD